MDAEEARRIYLSKALTTEKALEQIKASAEGGSNETIFLGLTENVVLDLMQRGYTLSAFRDNWGANTHRVQW